MPGEQGVAGLGVCQGGLYVCRGIVLCVCVCVCLGLPGAQTEGKEV